MCDGVQHLKNAYKLPSGRVWPFKAHHRPHMHERISKIEGSSGLHLELSSGGAKWLNNHPPLLKFQGTLKFEEGWMVIIELKF